MGHPQTYTLVSNSRGRRRRRWEVHNQANFRALPPGAFGHRSRKTAPSKTMICVHDLKRLRCYGLFLDGVKVHRVCLLGPRLRMKKKSWKEELKQQQYSLHNTTLRHCTSIVVFHSSRGCFSSLLLGAFYLQFLSYCCCCFRALSAASKTFLRSTFSSVMILERSRSFLTFN